MKSAKLIGQERTPPVQSEALSDRELAQLREACSLELTRRALARAATVDLAVGYSTTNTKPTSRSMRRARKKLSENHRSKNKSIDHGFQKIGSAETPAVGMRPPPYRKSTQVPLKNAESTTSPGESNSAFAHFVRRVASSVAKSPEDVKRESDAWRDRLAQRIGKLGASNVRGVMVVQGSQGVPFRTPDNVRFVPQTDNDT